MDSSPCLSPTSLLDEPTYSQMADTAAMQELAKFLSFPLAKYVRFVLMFLEANGLDYGDGTDGGGRFVTPLFHFTRLCHAHLEIDRKTSDAAMRIVDGVLRAMDGLPAGKDPWTHFFPRAESEDAARIDFQTSWDAVRHIPFRDVLVNASRMATAKPLVSRLDRGRIYNNFISVAGWLQVIQGDQNIFLPTRRVAEILRCDQRTVSRLCSLAVRDGYLVQVAGFRFRSKGKSSASEFRFQVKWLQGLPGVERCM